MSDSQTGMSTGAASQVGGATASSFAGAYSSAAAPPNPLSRAMRRVSLWLILTLVGSYTFLDYWAYSVDYHQHPETYELFMRGEGTAPAQYRIGLIAAAKVLHNVARLGYRHSFTLFDFVFALAALFLLRGVLAGTRSFQAAEPLSRWLRLAVVLGLASFYFSWSLWYQRPETMACAFYTACSLYLLTVVRSQPLAVAGLVLLATWQGFVRADVAILFHFGLFVYVLLRGGRDFLASRTALLLTSFICCVLPTAILWVLMHKVFPQATYGDTKVFQLLFNLSPTQFIACLLFLVPVLYTCKRALAGLRDGRLEGPQGALLLGSLLYFVSWALVGRLQEVRIFVPFAMALMPLGANLAADEITAEAPRTTL